MRYTDKHHHVFIPPDFSLVLGQEIKMISQIIEICSGTGYGIKTIGLAGEPCCPFCESRCLTNHICQTL